MYARLTNRQRFAKKQEEIRFFLQIEDETAGGVIKPENGFLDWMERTYRKVFG